MNVACSSCPAKYAVPDEKVRGKKVRITCKRCGTAIIVDGTAEPAAAAAEPAPAPVAKVAPKAERVRHKTMLGGLQASANSAPGAPGGTAAAPAAAAPVKVAAAASPSASAAEKRPVNRVERTEPALAARPSAKASVQRRVTSASAGATRWTVAVTEDDHRDLTVDEIAALYADRVIDGDTYVWRDGMADWVTPFEVAEIAAVLSGQGQPPADDAHDPGRASGSWHEPGRWDAPADAEPGFDEVTVAMDGSRARMLVEAASSVAASPVPPPRPDDTPAEPAEAAKPAETDAPGGAGTPGFTAEAAPYSPPARPVAASEAREEPRAGAVENLLDSLPTPAVTTSGTEGASFSSVALPLVAPKADATTTELPDVAPSAPATPAVTGSAPRAAVSSARHQRGDLFSKEAQATREASPRARMPSIQPDVVFPRAPMPSAPPDEPPRAKLPSVSDEPRPRPRMASAPPEAEAAAGGGLTGARNESSVLFSLDALAGKNKAQAAPSPKAEEDLLMGGSSTSDAAPPSVANLQNAALFNTTTMAVPDFAAPIAASAPEHSAPDTPDAPKKTGGGMWGILTVLALLGGGAAAYFLLYPKYVKAPEPPAPVATSTPGAAEPAPPAAPAEPAPAASDIPSAEALPSATAAAAGSATPLPSAGAPASASAASPASSAAAAPPLAPAGTKPLQPKAQTPASPAAPGASPDPKATAPAGDKPAEAADPAPAEGPPFDRDAAQAALAAAASAAVAQCSSLEGTHGNGKVTVTFVNSGRATNALVSGDFAGSALGGCVAKVFRGSKVPPFGGETVKVTKGLQIP